MFVVTTVGHNGYVLRYDGELLNYEKFLPIAEYMLNSFDTIGVTHGNSSTLVEKGVDLLYNQDNSSEALKYFDKALALHPNSIDAVFFKGAALDNLGNHTQAYPLITEAIQLSKQNLTSSPKNVDVLTVTGRAFNRIGNFPEAIKYFDKALAVDPNYKYALANKGLALSRLGNYTGAIKYFDKALAVDPKFVYALGNKAETIFNEGDFTLSLKYVDNALSIYPNNIQLLTLKATIYDNLHRYGEASDLKLKVRSLKIGLSPA
jgi:tetratricopeptide (TPR) repeat protein